MILKSIISLIIADATCQWLIGQYGSAYKVFPVVAEQEAKKPYVTLRRTAGSSIIVKGLASDADNQFVKVTAFAETYKECVDILEAIRDVIDNQRGTIDGLRFDRILYQTTDDLFDKDDNAFVISDTYLAIHLR